MEGWADGWREQGRGGGEGGEGGGGQENKLREEKSQEDFLS